MGGVLRSVCDEKIVTPIPLLGVVYESGGKGDYLKGDCLPLLILYKVMAHWQHEAVEFWNVVLEIETRIG